MEDDDQMMRLNADDKFIEILSASGVTSHLAVSFLSDVLS